MTLLDDVILASQIQHLQLQDLAERRIQSYWNSYHLESLFIQEQYLILASEYRQAADLQMRATFCS